MKILVVHNKYRFKGGEDSIIQEDIHLLKSNGHNVVPYYRDSRETDQLSILQRIQLARQVNWSEQTYEEVRALIREMQPDIVHVHNILPFMSPSVFYACAEMGVPVVQTLHNFRLLCPAATFLRNGKICERCHERNLLESIRFGCYRNSRLQSMAVANMLWQHHRRETFQKHINAFIVLTQFHKNKFVEAGFAPERIHIRANFTQPVEKTNGEKRNFALFIGRLTAEKGLHTLLNAWRDLPDIPLKIAGTGELYEALRMWVENKKMHQVELLGFIDAEQRTKLLAQAKFLVVPSIWYEGMPMVILEALAAGVPVLASRIGGLAEVIDDGEHGLLFKPANEGELREKARHLFNAEALLDEMQAKSTEKYQAHYSPGIAYQNLISIYEQVISKNGAVNAELPE